MKKIYSTEEIESIFNKWCTENNIKQYSHHRKMSIDYTLMSTKQQYFKRNGKYQAPQHVIRQFSDFIFKHGLFLFKENGEYNAKVINDDESILLLFMMKYG